LCNIAQARLSHRDHAREIKNGPLVDQHVHHLATRHLIEPALWYLLFFDFAEYKFHRKLYFFSNKMLCNWLQNLSHVYCNRLCRYFIIFLFSAMHNRMPMQTRVAAKFFGTLCAPFTMLEINWYVLTSWEILINANKIFTKILIKNYALCVCVCVRYSISFHENRGNPGMSFI